MPAVTPVTTPVTTFTVSIAALPLLHVPPVGVPLSVIVEPRHKGMLPEIMGVVLGVTNTATLAAQLPNA